MPQAYARAAPFPDMRMRPDPASGFPGRTYKFLDAKAMPPLWPFGHGLSYTSFAIRLVDPPAAVPAAGGVQIVVEVTNTGGVEGGVVVACYATAPAAQRALRPPARALFGFARLEALVPRAAAARAFTLAPEARSLVTPEGTRVQPGGAWTVTCEAGGLASTGPHTLQVGDDEAVVEA